MTESPPVTRKRPRQFTNEELREQSRKAAVRLRRRGSDELSREAIVWLAELIETLASRCPRRGARK